MNLELSGKVAIVTGASRGIGCAIAQTLAAEGMRIVLVARTTKALQELSATLPSDCLIQTIDLREADAATTVIEATLGHFGRLDVLVNNAGATKRGDFIALSDTEWNDGFALKFFSAMRCARAAWPALVESQGNIVNIVGVGGRTASAEFTIGGAVNAALLNLTKALADRGVKDGVRVNAINPSSIATERLAARVQAIASAQGIDPVAAAQRMAETLGVARFGEAREIANAVAFLASSRASYCQGAILDIDGGQTRTL